MYSTENLDNTQYKIWTLQQWSLYDATGITCCQWTTGWVCAADWRNRSITVALPMCAWENKQWPGNTS